jgi:hypothetical protein
LGDSAGIYASGIGAISTIVAAFVGYKVAARSESKQRRLEQRTSAYEDMLVVIDHVLASADAAAPMEGDFGSLREEFDMDALGRSRVTAKIKLHGSAEVRNAFNEFIAKYGELQKWSMHAWDVQDRSRLEGFAVSGDYGLNAVDEARHALREMSERLELAVRAELHPVG